MGETSTHVQWIGGQKYLGIDSTKHSIVLSSASEGIGVKPSETLLLSLAACTAHDVVEILAKKRTPLSFLEIITTGEQDPTPPWPFRRIHLKYRVRGAGLTAKARGTSDSTFGRKILFSGRDDSRRGRNYN